jgi:DNA replication protein DnaC
MAKPTPAQRQALIDHYIKSYAESNGHPPVVNRNNANFTMDSILRDLGKQDAQSLLDYFIEHYDRDLEWFNYNYEKVIVAKQEHERAEETRRKQRADTALAVERWKKKREELDAERRGRTH